MTDSKADDCAATGNPLLSVEQGRQRILDAVEAIMSRFQGVHTICGLSNISYGLPVRDLVNRTFAVMAVARGLDSIIVNPLDRKMMANLIAAETLAGRDEFCTDFLQAYREKKFEPLIKTDRQPDGTS